jgi:hypothetical protein
MSDEQYHRYVHINLPHARTIVQRIARELDLLGAFREDENGGAMELHTAVTALEQALRPFDDDPACEPAIAAADAIAGHARTLVAAVLATAFRGDRLGQGVRNLFECLGLAEEGASLSLECGERPDSLLR